MSADEVAIPALLRASRRAYGHAIRRHLAAEGFDDLPRNGPFVLGGLANRGVPARDLLRQLGVSKRRHQLVDTLVLRGYLVRTEDVSDRRRNAIEVTERGRAAATAVGAGVTEVDQELAAQLTADQLASMRAGLIALCDIRDRYEAPADGI